MQVQSLDQQWQPGGYRKYQQEAAQNVLPVTCADNGCRPAESKGKDEVKAAGGQVMRPPQVVNIATRIVQRRVTKRKRDRAGEVPDGLHSEETLEKAEKEQDKFAYHGHLCANGLVSPGKHSECEGAVLLYEH